MVFGIRWPWFGSDARFTEIWLGRAEQRLAAGDAVGAFQCLARAAQRGGAAACLRVGRAYLEGMGVPPSVPEGMRWLERAAAQDHVPAQTMLAALLLRGLSGAPAAAGTSATAALFQTMAGGAVARPQGASEPDFDAALGWAERSAASGSPDGQALLAYIRTTGPERLRDLEQARDLYRQAAEAGSAQGALGYALALASVGKTAED